jgi:ABC-type nickel/cobalt efflux system permease component RcnA
MTTADSEDTLPIADKVRFWEEQDKINQELIPRVIRQHELLTTHIADHENLPLVAANAISEALTEALQQQQERYEAALAEVKAESEEQHHQHQAEMEAAKTDREAQTQQHADEATTLREQLRKTRQMLITIATGAAVLAAAALVVAIVV